MPSVDRAPLIGGRARRHAVPSARRASGSADGPSSRAMRARCGDTPRLRAMIATLGARQLPYTQMFVLPVRIILLDTRAERVGFPHVTDASPAASVLERELAAEQAHVDLVYARLAEATRSAQQVARAGLSLYQSDRNSYVREEDGTGLYERDVFCLPGRSTAGCAGCRTGGAGLWAAGPDRR